MYVSDRKFHAFQIVQHQSLTPSSRIFSISLETITTSSGTDQCPSVGLNGNMY